MAVSFLFDELLLDPDIFVAGSATGGPQRGNTTARNEGTGVRKTNISRYDSQEVWQIQTDLLSPTQLSYFLEFWQGGFGSAYGFRCVIVSDFCVLNEVFGTGNGSQTVFSLIRTYMRPGASHSYVRRIIKPVVNSGAPSVGTITGVTLYEPDGVTPRVFPSLRAQGQGIPTFRIRVNGATVTNYTLNNTTGIVTFAAAPTNGHSIDWSGEYDTPMAFDNNSLQLRPDVASDVQGLVLREILPSELGIS